MPTTYLFPRADKDELSLSLCVNYLQLKEYCGGKSPLYYVTTVIWMKVLNGAFE